MAMDEPRYMQVTRSLMRALRQGAYPIGSLLPTELQLAEQHKVSRHTVREAMRQLESHGMVSRRAGVGTRVEPMEQTSGYRQSLGTIDDLVQFGERHVRAVEDVGNIVLDIDTAEVLGCLPGSRWLWLSSMRWDEAHDPRIAVCWTDNYVDPLHQDIGSIIADHPGTLISSVIEQRYRRRAAKVKQSVEAIGMPNGPASALKVGPGSPALRVVRQYLDELDEIFIATLTFHPERRFTLSTTLSRDV